MFFQSSVKLSKFHDELIKQISKVKKNILNINICEE